MNALLTSVLAGLILGAIVYFVKSRIATQPRLRLRVLPYGSMSFSESPGTITCSWNQKLEIYNLTAFPALNVTFVWPDSARQLPVAQLDPPHLNAMETKTLEFKIAKAFPREDVIACRDRFKELLPVELRRIAVVLQYQNDRGSAFYTRYEKTDATETSTFHRIKPKI